jgi:hypothetical protein
MPHPPRLCPGRPPWRQGEGGFLPPLWWQEWEAAWFAWLCLLGLHWCQAADASACTARSQPRVKGGGVAGLSLLGPHYWWPRAKLGGGQQRLMHSRCPACTSWHWQGVGGNVLMGIWQQCWCVGGSALVLGRCWDGGSCAIVGLLLSNVVG